MNFGLPDDALQSIIRVIQQHAGVTKAAVFGSRAKGTFRSNSDIDLALWGVNAREAEAIHLELEELPLPYLFSVLSVDDADSAPLLEHLERVGQTVFEAPASSEL